MEKFDIVVIGSGPGGFAAAMRSFDFGKHVCIVEANHIGGAGIMNGALTSKTMWELSADFAVAGATDRGYRSSSLNVDYVQVRKSVFQAAKDKQYQILSQIETFSKEKSKKGSLTLKRGHGSFIDKNRIKVVGKESDEIIWGDYVIIATGSVPRELPDLMTDGKMIVNSDQILNMEKFPERMIIIGSGIIGCEFATIFANFKQTEVHLLDRTNRVIPYEDNDLSDFVSKNLEGIGVNIHYEAALRNITKKNDYLEVILDYDDGHSKVFQVDVAIIAVGRVPNTENLGLDNLGYNCTKRGMIDTDDYCNIKGLDGIDNVFAVGDITGHGQLYNIAQLQGRLTALKIFNNYSEAINYRTMSTLMFFKPEVAAVGQNEKELKRQKIPYKVAVYSNKLVNRAIAMRNTNGFVKIIVSNDGNNRILGMRAASPQASAFIISVAHLIDENDGLKEVLKTVHPHPGVTEGIEDCLRLFDNASIFKPEAFPGMIKYYEWNPSEE